MLGPERQVQLKEAPKEDKEGGAPLKLEGRLKFCALSDGNYICVIK